MSSKICIYPDPNGKYLGNWMDARYRRADEESKADFRALQAAKAEAVKKSNIQSREIVRRIGKAFEEASK